LISPEPATRVDCAVGAAVARIAEMLVKKNVLVIAAGDYRARDIHAALQGASPKTQVIYFPSSDALPGDSQPPTPANIGMRMAALKRARKVAGPRSGVRVCCVTTAEAASELLPDPKTFDGALSKYAVGGRFDQDAAAFAATLRNIGYFEDDRVDEPAEYAIRGRVIDIFPADARNPVRIEIAEGKIARIREFDSVSQRGVRDLPFVELGSAAVPVFPGKGHPLFDYFPGAVIAIDPGAGAERSRFLALAADSATGPASKSAGPKKLVSQNAWDTELKARRTVDLAAKADEKPMRFAQQRDPVKAMNVAIAAAMKERARIVIAGNEHDLRFVKKRLPKKLAQGARPIASWEDADKGWLNRVKLLEMKLEQGWRGKEMLVVSASDVIGGNAGLAAASGDQGEHLLEIGDVCIGDVVIHEDHGIAVISGLRQPSGAGANAVGEVIELEYAAGAKRLVPVEEADRIWRYGADRTAVTLDGLDGVSWRKRRLVIDRAMTEAATELMRLSKENARRKAAKIDPDPNAYQDFVTGFPFSETPDQLRAIAAAQEDLASGKPMDRLVIGDVGYGKTEVALRAAALTALAGKQVIIAAPTTVLVRQHYETFQRRFERTGLKVASLSRLADTAERKRVKAGLADGSISVVVGTAAVAGKDVEYAKLGLVVIDEEQRFGAADKATLRDLGDKGHVLTLTATPIPRTLQNAMLGLKQMSVIATPPARRQPIRTFTSAWDDHQVRTALLREKDRGGQSFVVVPRIADIDAMEEKIHRLAPELSVLKAHGDMPAAEIDTSMVRFANGLADVLLATNIIEAGLDVPRANTMIIWRADRFGLAQLHQLRGRVGRGARRGHILLTTEPGASLTEATKKRLRTLESLDRLGAGFAISARDLDIRGAGDLVGDAQSGHMKLIGIDLYQHLLERAVREARGETLERWTPTINVGLSGRIPPDWIPEADTRLSLYLRLARLTTREELKAFEDELIDRFGPEPEEAATLLRIAEARVMARNADIAKVDAGPSAIAFTPRADVTKRAATAAGLRESNGRLLLDVSAASPVERLKRVEDILGLLARKPKRA
jgi:transcription-repair coupling factor (superfamily II helicase)